MKKITKIITVITVFALMFTRLPTMGGSIDAHAAGVAAPAQVKNLKATNITHTSVKLTWTKIAKNRNTKGYAIYRNCKLIKRVSFKTNTFTNTKLKAGTKYKFTVRAYNTYKQKQYYNSKTKKWQAKKPTTKQWKGKKTRTVTAYKYGKVSATRNVTTKKATKKATTTKAVSKSAANSSVNSGTKSNTTTTSGSNTSETQNKPINTMLSGEPGNLITIEENNPVITIKYNPAGGNITWTVDDIDVARVIKTSDSNGAMKLTLAGGNTYGRTHITATYNKKHKDSYYEGYSTWRFNIENKKVISCSNLKIENRLPIYDYSYPSFNGIPEASVKKVLDFDADRNVERAIISCNFSKPLIEGDDNVEFFNKTTSEKLWGPHTAGMFGKPLDIGFCYVKYADVSNPELISIHRFGFATKTGKEKYIFTLELEPGTVVQGNNTIEMRVNDELLKTFTINVKSRANRYYEFAKSISESSGLKYYSPEDKKCTGDVTLLRKLRGIERHINEIYEYPACVKSTFGNASVVTIGTTGRQIDSGLGGCEDGAIMMSICAMYNGVDASYKYVNGHCICVIPDSVDIFGFGKTFDATPHSGDYTSASKERMVEYLNSISKIL